MKLNLKTKIYIGLLSVFAILIYSFMLESSYNTDIKLLIFWTILSIIVESLLIPLPNNAVGVSVGYAINIASLIVGGPLIATTSSFLGVLCRVAKVTGKGYIHTFNLPLYKTVFNVSQSIIVTTTIGLIYIFVGGKVGEFNLIPTIVILLFGVLLNTVLISGFLSVSNNTKFFKTWGTNIKGVFPSAVAVGSLGVIMALAYISYGYGAVILFFGPLLLARYSFKLYVEMRNLYISTIQALNKTIEAKDSYTSGHASRVEELAVRLGEDYNLPFDKIEDLKTAAILHDIGKIGIHDSILNKAAELSQEELQEIMKHPSIGAEIIDKVDFLKNITPIIKHHHERYDGKGYPDGLKGDEIPIEACILTIVDSYDAMISDRPYRKALSKEEALEEIRVNAGTQFHPELAERFVSIMLH
ncbi:HD-GYP domain-containing protein [Paratissierella segnis]|jgi:putative nucleotidyltransferase with HDIG domain|uniref:HD-GYP domain-containing protein n=1 Tax=Paratissierella segnis TaxID=2763679 RepID=A0A926EUR6_9FIRM|nr:HD-GYP domain-containing protein [Paratissierella segnis]MBC8587882.1 HD-GYP domain-containing protein [Paratissierella segnis]